LCQSIVKVNSNSEAFTSILNTTNEDIQIDEPQIRLESFDNDMIKILNLEIAESASSNHDSERLVRLNNAIRVDHLNEEEYKSLIDTCYEYNHIFI
jgi:hypothetical protein